jgi:hypothetical protein
VDAKLAHVGPLMHKFAKRSGFKIFRNESLGNFGPFRYGTKVLAKLAE